MNLRTVLQISLTAASITALAGVVVNAQTATPAPTPAPATQPTTMPVTFVPPLFTEDFESGTINKDVWKPMVMGTCTVDITQDKVAHGKNALHVHYPANAPRGYAILLSSKLPDAVKTHLFGRVYVMVAPKFANSHTVLMFAGTENWPISNFLEIGDQNNKFQPSFQQNDTVNTPPRGETVTHGVAFPANKWFCLEWEMNDAPDSISTWIDGQPADSKPFSFKGEGNTGLVKQFANFGIGARLWGNTPDAFDVYYDDLAIGTGRIGPIKD
jgi:hypothetical protein